jgi:peroxiredoxin Q/BCP
VGNHRGSHKGHSFVLVSPDGEIRWRADYGYGGAPDYTMYLPVDNLLADLRTGISGENTA